MASLQLNHIYKVYPNGVKAVNDFTMDIEDKEFIVFVGPSGCGKSTTLRMIAGLEEITAGELRIGDVVVNDMEPKDRDIAMVFQNYALYPHMTVYENMAFGLKLRKVPKDEIDRKVREAAEILGITEYLDRKPKAMSGGQRQRVALGRAIVREPKAFLLDEPLSNLDARLRLQTREEIKRIQRETGITTVFVTHDQEEAMSISDQIVVMKLGVVQQTGEPQAVYDNPINLFVAKFLGTPPINVFNGTVKAGKLYIGDDAVLDVPGIDDREVHVGIRPEGFIYAPDSGVLHCKLSSVEVMGRDVSIVSKHEFSENPIIRSIVDADNKIDTANPVVRFNLKPHKVFIFDAETEARLYFNNER